MVSLQRIQRLRWYRKITLSLPPRAWGPAYPGTGNSGFQTGLVYSSVPGCAIPLPLSSSEWKGWAGGGREMCLSTVKLHLAVKSSFNLFPQSSGINGMTVGMRGCTQSDKRLVVPRLDSSNRWQEIPIGKNRKGQSVNRVSGGMYLLHQKMGTLLQSWLIQ